MSIHFGDVPSGSTLYIPFCTYDSNGASVTMSGFATSDILIYKDGSTTQRSSTAGFTLLDTDGIDFDSVTGLQGFSVDLSDDTDSGFYATGSQYWVVVSTVTIDSQTVTLLAATFRIVPAESSSGVPKVDLSHIAGSAVSTSSAQLGVNVVNAAGTAWGSGAITSGTFASGAITATAIAADAIGASELAADAVAEIADGVWDEGISGHQTASTFGRELTVGGGVLQDTTITGTPTSTTLQLTAGSTVDNFYNDQTLHIVSGTGIGQARVISDYTGSSKTITVDEAFVTTPASGDQIVILSNHVHPITQIQSKVLTSQLTEGYAANGTAPTLTEAIFAIHQMLMDFSISGTSLTVKKLDDSTTAFTVTLDDGTTPTGASRT